MKYYINIFIFLSFTFSQAEQPYPPLDLVTIPTSGTLPKGSFTLESLLIKDGGIIPKLSVGITDNFYIGLSFLITWIIIALITKYSSLSSILASFLAPSYFILIIPNHYVAIFLSYITVIIIFKHRENIKKLLNKTENKIKLSN